MNKNKFKPHILLSFIKIKFNVYSVSTKFSKYVLSILSILIFIEMPSGISENIYMKKRKYLPNSFTNWLKVWWLQKDLSCHIEQSLLFRPRIIKKSIKLLVNFWRMNTCVVLTARSRGAALAKIKCVLGIWILKHFVLGWYLKGDYQNCINHFMLMKLLINSLEKWIFFYVQTYIYSLHTVKGEVLC